MKRSKTFTIVGMLVLACNLMFGQLTPTVATQDNLYDTDYRIQRAADFVVPDGYVACTPGETNPEKTCFVRINKQGKSYEQIMTEKLQRSVNSNSFACEMRPFRWIIAYDETMIGVEGTKEEIEANILANSVEKMERVFDNSKLNHHGIKYWIRPVSVPAYTSIFEPIDWLQLDDDGMLDNLSKLKNDSLDADYLQLIISPSAVGKGVNKQNTSVSMNHELNFGVVNYQTMVVGGATSVHECGHGIGCGHDGVGTSADPDARAWVNLVQSGSGWQQTYGHTIMKSGDNIAATLDVLSGPEAEAENYFGYMVNPYDSVEVTDNAKYAQMLLDAFVCDNDVIRVRINPVSCAQGMLVTEKAFEDSEVILNWTIMSGSPELSSTTGDSISYTNAYTESEIMVIASHPGKIYQDTAYMMIPAMQLEDQGTMTVCQGEEVLLDNDSLAVAGLNEYTMPGDCNTMYQLFLEVLPHEYIDIDTMMHVGDMFYGVEVQGSDTITVTLPGEANNGCDLIVTGYIQITTSNTNLPEIHNITLYPNPTTGMLRVKGIEQADMITIYDMLGRQVLMTQDINDIDLTNLSDGIYMLYLELDGAIYRGKVTKSAMRAGGKKDFDIAPLVSGALFFSSNTAMGLYRYLGSSHFLPHLPVNLDLSLVGLRILHGNSYFGYLLS